MLHTERLCQFEHLMPYVSHTQRPKRLANQANAVVSRCLAPLPLAGELVLEEEARAEGKYERNNGNGNRPAHRSRCDAQEYSCPVQRGNVNPVITDSVTVQGKQPVVADKTAIRPSGERTGDHNIKIFYLTRGNFGQHLGKDFFFNARHLLQRPVGRTIQNEIAVFIIVILGEADPGFTTHACFLLVID